MGGRDYGGGEGNGGRDDSVLHFEQLLSCG